MVVSNSIKYDKKAQKRWLIRMIVSGVIILIYILFLTVYAYLFAGGKGDTLRDNGLLMLLFALASSLGTLTMPFFVISVVFLVDSTIYLRRLKKNHFEVPMDKKVYDYDLTKVPRTEKVENVYSRDSIVGGLLFLAAYIIFVAADINYVIKWTSLGENGSIVLFVMMMMAHLFFAIFAVIMFRQKNTSKYIDVTDVGEYEDSRKKRYSLNGIIIILVITSVISSFGISLVFSMTKYVYKSRNGHYDKTTDDFKEKATMKVSSEDLINGRWNDRITNTDKGENLSPELSFDMVEGAEYYYIYMVDETANNWVHWVATDVREVELDTGANATTYKGSPDFKYVGPYPPQGSGDHVYTIYIYAMKGKPGRDREMELDEPSLSGDYMYYDYLSISKMGDPNEYGNVIAYGYISGTYSR